MATLRRCLPTVIGRALDELPKSLDETYERTLLGIEEEKREFAHRLFQCLTVAVRPFRVDELAQVLAIRFCPGQLPQYQVDWHLDDAQEAVLSTCSSLISVVNVNGSPLVQFSHFSVKEFLTSDRLAKSTNGLSRFHVMPSSAHAILAQASLSVLLHLGNHVDKDCIKKFPLAQYAAQYWVNHGRFEDVSSKIQDAMECLFDVDKPSFATWIWIYDIDYPFRQHMFEDYPPRPEAGASYYATLCGFRNLVEHLIAKYPGDINSRGGRHGSAVNAALVKRNTEITLLLLSLGADVNILDVNGCTPLYVASESGCRDHVELLLKHRADVDLLNGRFSNTALGVAAQLGEIEIARVLLHHGASVDSQDKKGWTPLKTASRYGHLDIVQLLIQSGAGFDTPDNEGWVPLFAASRYGHLDIVRLLIQSGAAADYPPNEVWTPLFAASRYGHLDILQLLIQSGAAVDTPDNEGWTPLFAASRCGHLDIVRLLIRSRAAVDTPDEEGWTPLFAASRYGHLDIVQLLIQSGAVVDTPSNEGWMPLFAASRCGHLDIVRLLIASGAAVGIPDNEGWTPLFAASRYGYLDIMRVLVQSGAAVDTPSNEGWTPLFAVSRYGHLDIVRLLIQSGAAVDTPDNEGWTPLKAASRYGYLDIVELLIQTGAAVDTPDNEGWTPLFAASRYGHLRIAQVLIHHGAAINAQCTGLSTPLHYASSAGHLSVVELLIEHHADVYTRDKHHQTPLHRATAEGRLDIARFLLRSGSSPDRQDDNGSITLHTAAQNGHLDLVKLLVESGMDVNVKNSQSQIPLDVEIAGRKREVTRYLANHMVVMDPCDGLDSTALDNTPDNPVPDATLTSVGISKNRHPRGRPSLSSLHDACAKGSVEDVQSLLGRGTDINGRNADHYTALLVATGNGKLGAAKELIKNGADVNCRTKTGWTPLMFASRSGYRDIAELLLDHGADVNTKKENLWTALHLASSNGHLEIVKLLLDKDADIHARNIDGHTPSRLASRRGEQDIVCLLSGVKVESPVVWILFVPFLPIPAILTLFLYIGTSRKVKLIGLKSMKASSELLPSMRWRWVVVCRHNWITSQYPWSRGLAVIRSCRMLVYGGKKRGRLVATAVR